MAIADDYHTRPEWAKHINKSVRTVARMDAERRGPPVTYIGRKPYYRKSSAQKWLDSLECRQVNAP